jgi:hypothetical protein
MNPARNIGGAPVAETPREGLSRKMTAIISALDEATERMQNAIVSQDVKVIWDVLAEQERIAAEFQQCACLWGHLAAAGRGNPEIERNIGEMDRAFEAVRRKNRCNMALIKSYLAAVERALRANGTPNARKLSVYGRHGKMQYRQSSIALNKEG